MRRPADMLTLDTPTHPPPCTLDTALAMTEQRGWEALRLYQLADQLQITLESVSGQFRPLADRPLHNVNNTRHSIQRRLRRLQPLLQMTHRRHYRYRYTGCTNNGITVAVRLSQHPTQ